MKKFLLKLCAFLSIVIIMMGSIVAIDFCVIGNQYTHSYNASILDKMERLNSIEEPKIILVGNSNLSFGMNSPAIEQTIGMPVVNLGLHGGLGNAFHEEMAKDGIKEGDIVVLCHLDYANNELSDPALAWITIEKHFSLWPLIRIQDVPSMLRGYPQYVIQAARNWLSGSDVPQVNSCYARNAFNEHGDIVVRPNQETTQFEFYEGSITVPEIGKAGIERINRFHDYVKSKGATLLVSFFPVASGEFTPPEDMYINMQKELTEQLDCEIISDIRDYFIPYEFFYDTAYHLDDQGVEMRTKQLIADLQEWFSNRQD